MIKFIEEQSVTEQRVHQAVRSSFRVANELKLKCVKKSLCAGKACKQGLTAAIRYSLKKHEAVLGRLTGGSVGVPVYHGATD